MQLQELQFAEADVEGLFDVRFDFPHLHSIELLVKILNPMKCAFSKSFLPFFSGVMRLMAVSFL